jgi:hypothetical protein
MNSFSQRIHLIDEFIETSTALTLGRMLAILLLEDTAPLLRLEYWVVVIMRHTMGILTSEVGFAILPVKSPSVIASPVVGRAVAVLASSEVAAMVYNDRVRHVEAATVSIRTKSTDNAQDDPRCHTDNAREVPGSVGVADVDKEDPPTVACVESRLLQWVGVRGCWLRNMLQMNQMNSTETYLRKRSDECQWPSAGDKVVEEWKCDVE